MKILVIGSGGREHALVWKLAQSSNVEKIYCAPGNPGIAEIADCVQISPIDFVGLKKFVNKNGIDLTVVGPELPLVYGIVDEFQKAGLCIFGPTMAASQLEGSKVSAKRFMKKYEIPTAQFETFEQHEYDSAKQHVSKCNYPVVIKADGLAAGKGVTICATQDEAYETLHSYFEDRIFDDAGSRIVIEEFMQGEEASVFALTDGKRFITLSPAQDHKRAFDNDAGKNTGGMGAYAPAPIVSPEVLQKVEDQIIIPTLFGMVNDGYPYKGCLYIGLMIHNGEPKVVEYNCRFGDPETQAILPLLEDDLAEIMMEIATGTLKKTTAMLKKKHAVCVVLASGGYPDSYQIGNEIRGISKIGNQKDVMVFHAGTKWENETFRTAGGRVLGVTSIDSNLQATIDKAYRAVKLISYDGMQFRTDIGKKGLTKK